MRSRGFRSVCFRPCFALKIAKTEKKQSHAECHITHWIGIFHQISEHVQILMSTDFAVPEDFVTNVWP